MLKSERSLACDCYKKHNALCSEPICPAHYALAARDLGRLVESEGVLRRVVSWCRANQMADHEIKVLRHYAFGLARRGVENTSALLLRRTIRLMRAEPSRTLRKTYWKHHSTFYCRIDRAIDSKNYRKAEALVARALAIQEASGNTYLAISLLSWRAFIASKTQDFVREEELARRALQLARVSGLDESVCTAAQRLAGCFLRRSEAQEARALIDEALLIARRGQSQLEIADGLLLRARYFQILGDQDQATRDATEAYRLAWCDGPPFAYDRGLKKAEELLRALGAVVPDGLSRKPLPADWIEVELDPAGEVPRSDGSGFRMHDFRESAVDRLLAQARESLGKNDYARAMAQATEAIRLDPRGNDCWQLRGKAHWFLGQFDRAESDFARSAELTPKDEFSWGWSNLARARDHALALGSLGRYDEAIQCLKSPGPQDEDMLMTSLRALKELERGHKAKAAQCLDAIREPDPQVPAWYRSNEAADYYFHALALRRIGRDQDARRIYRKILEPNLPGVPGWMADEAKAFLGA